jgi:hypothetical protein
MKLTSKYVAPTGQTAGRAIKRFDGPAPGPHRNPTPGTSTRASNEIAAKAVRTAKHPPGINGTQQRF